MEGNQPFEEFGDDVIGPVEQAFHGGDSRARRRRGADLSELTGALPPAATVAAPNVGKATTRGPGWARVPAMTAARARLNRAEPSRSRWAMSMNTDGSYLRPPAIDHHHPGEPDQDPCDEGVERGVQPQLARPGCEAGVERRQEPEDGDLVRLGQLEEGEPDRRRWSGRRASPRAGSRPRRRGRRAAGCGNLGRHLRPEVGPPVLPEGDRPPPACGKVGRPQQGPRAPGGSRTGSAPTAAPGRRTPSRRSRAGPSPRPARGSRRGGGVRSRAGASSRAARPGTSR